ncbi:hypothetical protein IJT93_02065, partial [bacterium]|nr:hypothetical protein [bacterium]
MTVCLLKMAQAVSFAALVLPGAAENRQACSACFCYVGFILRFIPRRSIWLPLNKDPSPQAQDDGAQLMLRERRLMPREPHVMESEAKNLSSLFTHCRFCFALRSATALRSDARFRAK